MFLKICKSLGMKGCVAEYKFHPKRKWRCDFAFPVVKLAIEIEGGIWNYGRHNRAIGFMKDMDKYNSLSESGFFLLRYQPNNIDYDQIFKVYKNLSDKEDA